MTTLKISDLSIGDWVEYCGRHYKVYSIEECGFIRAKCEDDYTSSHIGKNIDYLEPIPITAEILEKNGWSEFSDYHNSWKLDIASDKRVWMFKNSHDWTFQVMSWGLGHNHSVAKAYIKNIHDLQHALRAAGIDKEINL